MNSMLQYDIFENLQDPCCGYLLLIVSHFWTKLTRIEKDKIHFMNYTTSDYCVISMIGGQTHL